MLMQPCSRFWRQLTQPQKDRLFEEVREVHYDQHAPVRAAGDSCLGILYVKAGGLRLSLLSEEGREASIARLDAGQVCVLSASCVLSAVTFDVEITAEEESDVLVLPSHVFGPLMAENIYVECFVYRTATELFSDVIGAVERLLFMTLEQRVASFLLDEAARRGTDTLAITQEAIGTRHRLCARGRHARAAPDGGAGPGGSVPRRGKAAGPQGPVRPLLRSGPAGGRHCRPSCAAVL